MLREEVTFSAGMVAVLDVIRDSAFFDRASKESEDCPEIMRSLDDFTRSDHDMSFPSLHCCFFESEPRVSVACFSFVDDADEEGEADSGVGLKTARAKSLNDDGTIAVLLAATELDLLTMGIIRPGPMFECGVLDAGVGSCWASGR